MVKVVNIFLNFFKRFKRAGSSKFSFKSVNLSPQSRLLKVRNLRIALPLQTKNRWVNIILGIDLDVKQAEIVGIVGESGSGKSVTMRSLLGLNSLNGVEADKFEFSGIDCLQLKSERMWFKLRGSGIGYIPQDPQTSLNPTRKIGKQLLDALPKNDPRFKNKAERKRYLIELLERFGIRNASKWFYSYPQTLSGGMQQRVVITMVVATQPKLIIADEPTTALDPSLQSAVLALFEEIRRELGISFIFISHNISVVAKLCDYIYVMYAGRVVEKATKEAIFTNPKHPYTWSLISAIPEDRQESFYTIRGVPPDMQNLPPGDPFAPRNDFAVELDFKQVPPLFEVDKDKGHYAATWLLHPLAKGLFSPPKALQSRVNSFKRALLKDKANTNKEEQKLDNFTINKLKKDVEEVKNEV